MWFRPSGWFGKDGLSTTGEAPLKLPVGSLVCKPAPFRTSLWLSIGSASFPCRVLYLAGYFIDTIILHWIKPALKCLGGFFPLPSGPHGHTSWTVHEMVLVLLGPNMRGLLTVVGPKRSPLTLKCWAVCIAACNRGWVVKYLSLFRTQFDYAYSGKGAQSSDVCSWKVRLF